MMARNDLIPWRTDRAVGRREQDPWSSFQREMNRLFDSFWGGIEPRIGMAAAHLYSPNIDVHETDQAYRVTAELPGLTETDVELNLRDNNLVISGEKKLEREEKDDDRYYRERSFGRFQRVIPFAAEIDADKVQARFDKGVLTIELPKNAKARDKTRHIQINSGRQSARH
jgi:HSP20 family protein